MRVIITQQGLPGSRRESGADVSASAPRKSDENACLAWVFPQGALSVSARPGTRPFLKLGKTQPRLYVPKMRLP